MFDLSALSFFEFEHDLDSRRFVKAGQLDGTLSRVLNNGYAFC